MMGGPYSTLLYSLMQKSMLRNNTTVDHKLFIVAIVYHTNGSSITGLHHDHSTSRSIDNQSATQINSWCIRWPTKVDCWLLLHYEVYRHSCSQDDKAMPAMENGHEVMELCHGRMLPESKRTNQQPDQPAN